MGSKNWSFWLVCITKMLVLLQPLMWGDSYWPDMWFMTAIQSLTGLFQIRIWNFDIYLMAFIDLHVCVVFFQYIWACILIWRKKRCSSTVLWSLWSWLTVIISLTSCLTGLFTGWFLVNAALEVININHSLSSSRNKVSIIFQNCSCSYNN